MLSSEKGDSPDCCFQRRHVMQGPKPVSRRDFMRLSGLAFGTAGFAL